MSSISRQRKENKLPLVWIALILPILPAVSISCEELYNLDETEMINLAIQNSSDLEIAELNLLAATRIYKLGLREWLPALNISFGNDDSVIIGNPDTRTKRLAFTITQPVYNGGRSAAARKLQAYELNLQGRGLSRGKEDLADNVRTLYFHTLVSEEQARLRRETLTLIEEQFIISKTEAEMGMITNLDLIETELELKNYKIAQMETELAIKKLYFQIKQVLSLPPDTEVHLGGEIGSLYSRTGYVLDPESLTMFAKERNDSVQDFEFQLEQLQQQIRVQRFDFIPAIDVSGSFFIQGDSFPLQEPGFSIKVNFSIPNPLFPFKATVSAGSRTRNQTDRGYSAQTPVAADVSYAANRKTRMLELRAKQIEYAAFIDTLGFEMHMAVETYNAKLEKSRIERESLDLYKHRLTILKEQLRLGQLRRLEYLEARIELADRETAVLQHILDLIQSERDIEKLAGMKPGELQIYASQTEEI